MRFHNTLNLLKISNSRFEFALLGFLFFLNFKSFGQINNCELIQSALNIEALSENILMQKAIDLETQMTIHFDDDKRNKCEFIFLGKSLVNIDVKGSKDVVNNWNFYISKIALNKRYAKIEYRFYPNWLNCTNEREYVQYSNSLYFYVICKFKFVRGQWVLVKKEVKDVQFQDELKSSVYQCLYSKYVPLKH